MGSADRAQLGVLMLSFPTQTCWTQGRGGWKPTGEELAAFWMSKPWQPGCCQLPCLCAARSD